MTHPSPARRRGLTLVELVFATALFLALFLLIWQFFSGGRRTLDSASRKVDAIERTHLHFESLRHDLERCQKAWTPGRLHSEDGLDGSPLLVVDKKEFLFDAENRRLFEGGRVAPGRYADARFYMDPFFTIQFALRTDHASAAGSLPRHRERSTLVSKVFIEPMAEEYRARSHVWESTHGWCVNGGAIHYGFDD